jgi:MSHA pilin protein MshD
MNRRSLTPQIGATLVELVVSIVILSISVTGVMMVIAQSTRASADPMIRTQATAIAQAYLEEILAQPLTDPAGGDSGGAEAGEVRATYDDVNDYQGLNDSSGAVDQAGNAVPQLSAYNVAVAVESATLGGSPAQRIQVSVTHDGLPDFLVRIASYRLN